MGVESKVLRAGSAGGPIPNSAPGPRGRRGGFGEVMRVIGSAAVAAIPVVGPAIASAIPAIARRRGLPAHFDPNAPSDALRFLELQRAISHESRQFEVASNVMKARHDAAMAAIRNLKS